MQTINAHVEHCAFTRGFNFLVKLFLNLGNRFFDARGMNTPVGNKFFQSQARNLAANGVKTRQNDHFGRIVNNKLDTRGIFQRPYISAFAPYYSRLHIVAGNGHNRNGYFRSVVGGATLNGERNKLFRFVLRLVLCRLLYIPYLQSYVVAGFVQNLLG